MNEVLPPELTSSEFVQICLYGSDPSIIIVLCAQPAQAVYINLCNNTLYDMEAITAKPHHILLQYTINTYHILPVSRQLIIIGYTSRCYYP